MMHIAFCTDTNYIMPAGVAMVSVCENNQDDEITFHLVITDEETAPDEVDKKVKPLVDISTKYNKNVNIYRLSGESLSSFVCKGVSYVSPTAFARIFLPEILDSSITKVLYLDCDLVCDGSLKELWNTELKEDCPFGAVVDSEYASPTFHLNAEIPQHAKYVNSGVLLMNLLCWRKHNYVDLCVKVALEKKFPLLDQDLINHLFYQVLLYLPVQYNVQLTAFLDGIHKKHITLEYYSQIKEACTKPVILHFISANKPWKDEKCPLREIWDKYFNKSIWKGQPLSSVITRFDRSYIYDELQSAYWADASLFKSEAFAYTRLFKSAVKLKNKDKIMKAVSFMLNCMSGILESVYKWKSRK